MPSTLVPDTHATEISTSFLRIYTSHLHCLMEERLPPELLIHIFSFLTTPPEHASDSDTSIDKTALRSCLLVCRRWHEVALKPMYEDISLSLVYLSHRATSTDYWFIVLRRSQPTLLHRVPSDFAAFLAEKPYLAKYIRSLTLRCGRYSISKDRPAAVIRLPTFLDIITRLPNLESLTLRGIALDEAASPLPAWTPMPLKHLTIDWVVPVQHRDDAGYALDDGVATSALLRRFTVADTLALEHYAGGALDAACAGAARTLRRLVLRDSRTPPELPARLFAGAPAAPRALHLAEDAQSPLRDAPQALLNELGTTLVGFGWQLLLCAPTRRARSPRGWDARLDISVAPHLEALALDVVADSESAVVGALAALFRRAAPECTRLRTVALAVEFVPLAPPDYRAAAPPAASGALEDALLALWRNTGGTLLDVTLASREAGRRRVWEHAQAEKLLREWFPRLVECGMVRCEGCAV